MNEVAIPERHLVLSRKAVKMLKEIHYIPEHDTNHSLCDTKIFKMDKIVPLIVRGKPRTITCEKCQNALKRFKTVRIARPKKGQKNIQHLTGHGPPFPAQGRDGNFYLDKATGWKYKKICGAWIIIGKD